MLAELLRQFGLQLNDAPAGDSGGGSAGGEASAATGGASSAQPSGAQADDSGGGAATVDTDPGSEPGEVAEDPKDEVQPDDWHDDEETDETPETTPDPEASDPAEVDTILSQAEEAERKAAEQAEAQKKAAEAAKRAGQPAPLPPSIAETLKSFESEEFKKYVAEFPEVKPIVELTKTLAQENADLRQFANEFRQEREIKAVDTRLSAVAEYIRGIGENALNVEKYGDPSKGMRGLGQQKFEFWAAVDKKAAVLAKHYQTQGREVSESKLYRDAYLAMTRADQRKVDGKPTTRAQVFQEARTTSAKRTPAGLSRGGVATNKAKPTAGSGKGQASTPADRIAAAARKVGLDW